MPSIISLSRVVQKVIQQMIKNDFMYYVKINMIISEWYIKMRNREILRRITESPITFRNQSGKLMNHNGMVSLLTKRWGKFHEKEEMKNHINADYNLVYHKCVKWCCETDLCVFFWIFLFQGRVFKDENA